MLNDIEQHTTADDLDYKGHSVFQDLDKFIDFYDSLSFSVLSFSTLGMRAIINIDTYVYSSIQGTLESIRMVLKAGRLGDAFSLLRKYNDSIVLNLYTKLVLEEKYKRRKNKLFRKSPRGWVARRSFQITTMDQCPLTLRTQKS